MTHAASDSTIGLAILGIAMWDVVKAVFVCGGIGAVTLAWYRLYLHPLAQFPGPVLAAISDYYTTYYDLWKGGAQVKQLEKLHKIYGELNRESVVEIKLMSTMSRSCCQNQTKPGECS